MEPTSTRYLQFHTLNIRGQSSVTVVKLMMACNDLTLTNQALDDWKNEERRSRVSRKEEACRYFVRAQIAHLNEGLKIIEEIQTDHTLSALVSRCDARTQESFREVQQYASGGAKRRRFEQLAGRVRHNVVSHYDHSGRLIERAIAYGAARSRVSSITRGNTAHLWHFRIADDVVDSIVVRQFWDIPREGDLRAETDRVADEIHQFFVSFLDFAGEFIWKYCEH